MSETRIPASESRWRSYLGCSGCATIIALCVIVALVAISIATTPPTNKLRPSPLLQVSGVVVRTVLGLDPPSTNPPDAAAATPDTSDESPEEAAYFNDYDWYRSWMGQSEDRLHYLQLFSSFWSSRWKSQLAAEARSWRQLSLQVQQIDPPPGDEAIHGRLIAAFKEYAVAADDIDQFVQSGDSSAYDESQAALKRGDALIQQSMQIIAGGGSTLGPSGSDKTMTGGLLTEDDLPSGWVIASIPGDSVDLGPSIPCGDIVMFEPDEMYGGAGARFVKTDSQTRYLQELIASVDPWSADDGMSYAKIGFPCDPWTDNGTSYHIEQLVIPRIGDDTVAYRYARHDTSDGSDSLANVVLIRQGGLVIEVWLGGGNRYPGVDETVSIARAALDRAKSIPQDQEPDPATPDDSIQVDVPSRTGLTEMTAFEPDNSHQHASTGRSPLNPLVDPHYPR